MDPIIFILLFFTLLTMRTQRRYPVLTLYFVSLAATMRLFNHHVTRTSDLDLNLLGYGATSEQPFWVLDRTP